MSLATVASLRQHPPMSPLCSCHRDSLCCQWDREKIAVLPRMNWRFWRMVCCHGWSASAHRSSRLCLATWVPKVGVDTGQLGHEDPLLLVIIDQPSTCRRPPARAVCSPALLALIWSDFICTNRFSSSGACGWMDPAVLIFLLYMMIAHELVCGWMQYRRQSAKPRKRAAGPLLRSRCVRACACGCLRVCARDCDLGLVLIRSRTPGCR